MRRSAPLVLSAVVFVLALAWRACGQEGTPSRREELAARREQRAAVPPPTVLQAPTIGATELRIEGLVLDADTKQPIANATLEFEHDDEHSSATTDASGRFSLVRLEEGTWFLATVRANGYATGSPELQFEHSSSDVKLELTRLRERRGRVVDQAGHPIEGALIQPFAAVEFAGRELESTFSDAKGEFRLVAEALSRVNASHLCCVTNGVEVGPPEQEIVITLQPAQIERVTFKGRVLDEDDKPVEGARVTGLAYAGGPDVAQPISVVTSVGGRFQAEVPAKSEVELHAELGTANSGGQTFDAAEDATLVLLEHASSFSGRVTNEVGEPVKKFKVILRETSFWQEREFASPDGTYVFDELPKLERAVITVSALGSIDSDPKQRSLNRGEHATGIDFTLKRGLEVRGVVIDRETGHPLAGANVNVTDLGGRLSPPNGRARTDSLGRFVLSGLREGRLEGHISRSGYLSRSEVFDTANHAEVRIGLTSSSSPNAKDEYVGVGMQFSNAHVDAGFGYLVSSLHPQGGAHVAGVLVGDEILAADGVRADAVGTMEFLLLIKGAEGSVVTLTVRRQAETFDVHAVRRRLEQTW